MQVSYRWLRELLPGINRDPDQIADLLNGVGLAVDGIDRQGQALEAIVLAKVTKIEPHPERSGLRLVTVSTGKGEQTVVCGAQNVPDPGGLVVLAGIGVTLPGAGFTLTARKIGGVTSEGMLCSESELGLAEESEGILTYPAGSYEAGTPFIEALPEANDTIFEIDVTPNRPDALGHVGVARDLGALLGLKLELPGPGSPARDASTKLKSLITIENRDPERCPHYGAAAVRGVNIKPSPDWMRWRLHRLGIRPISNVVDITNWMLLEFGQPMHAFDLATVRDKKIVIRRAEAGEKFTTLDGVARTLDADDLVICDGGGPTALAGVMGGADSEISESTKDVLLECAYFTPSGVRRTARRHGMHTESSHRFERGTDYGDIELVLKRTQTLLSELADAKAVPGLIHLTGEARELPSIELRSQRLDQLLGVSVPFRDATRTLQRLGFDIEFVRDLPEGQVASVRGATWRPDVSIEADLIEEVARMRGLDNIPTVLPAIEPQTPRTAGRLERETADTAVALGLSEALCYAFVSRAELAAVRAPEPAVTLDNPLSEERSVLRTSLLPGLLESLRRARRRGERSVQLFNIGAIFLPPNHHARELESRPYLPGDRGVLPEERLCFTAVLAGPRAGYLQLKPEEVDVFDAKGVAQEMVERLTNRAAQVRLADDPRGLPHLHPRGASSIFAGDVRVGSLGPLHPDIVEALDLDGTAQIVELDLEAIETVGKAVPRYRPIPKLPAITRDLSLVVSDEVPSADVVCAITEAAGELCESVELAAEFRGGSVPEGHRSLTYRVVYRDPKAATDVDGARTLTDKEIDKLQAEVLLAAQRRVGATLRG